MITFLMVTACLLCPGGILETASRANGLEITLRMQKNIFFHSEPIAFEITITNTSNHDAIFGATDLPFKNVDYWSILNFDVSNTKLEVPLRDINNRFNTQTLKRNTKIRDVIYLQEYMSPFVVGDYLIPVVFYHLTTIGGMDTFMYAATALHFKIVPGDKKKRQDVLSSYLDLYRNALSSDEEYRAAKALVMMKDAEALPYLVRALVHQKNNKGKFIRFRQEPIQDELIESFASNKTAIAIVNEALDSKYPSMTVHEVLTVLKIWKYQLPNEKIKELQKRQDPSLDKQLHEYMEELRRIMKETQ